MKHFQFYCGWMAGMVSAMILMGILQWSDTPRWRAVEKGNGTFVVQTQYRRFGSWYGEQWDRYESMEAALREVEARRSAERVLRVGGAKD